MGKEGSLCGDSALMDAFDNALTKYKVMHNQGENSLSTDEEKAQCDENISTLSAQSCEARNSEKDVGDDAVSNSNKGDVCLPNNGNYQLESGDPDVTASSMNGQTIQSYQTDIPDTQTSEDYNQLLSRYYELEDQREKVLQQLSQFGYWDYQNTNATGSDDHTIPPATTASQEHQVYANQGSCSNVECTCCPYWCQLLSALSSSGLGAASANIVENPISIVEGKANEPETKFNLSADTDLNVVTNAWYTAGFHTGKYLAEQRGNPKPSA